MPELPEVECLARAVRKVLEGRTILDAKFLRSDLREPIPAKELNHLLSGERVRKVFRRSKYLLIQTKPGFGIIHLGMTGNLLVSDKKTPALPHTHAVFSFDPGASKRQYLHYIDPRRFGRIDCWSGGDYSQHRFFHDLGPEPLGRSDLAKQLFQKSRGRAQPIKTFLMDARNVVGVGNIYSVESLFRAGIRPDRDAGSLNRKSYETLVGHIRATLRDAIRAGGTTFRDFKNAKGDPGYFSVRLGVYGRVGEACRRCRSTIQQIKQSGRSTFFCPKCQK